MISAATLTVTSAVVSAEASTATSAVTSAAASTATSAATFGEAVSGLWAYWLIIVLMMVGLHIVIARNNLVKKVMGLNIFQAAAILFYVSMAKVRGGTAPIISEEAGHGAHDIVYSNPLPHVLMLTAIVVGVATTALALALAVRIHREYGTSEEDEAIAWDMEHG